MPTVNFDSGANLSAVQLEMTTIRHDGRVYGSIRRRLVIAPGLVGFLLYGPGWHHGGNILEGLFGSSVRWKGSTLYFSLDKKSQIVGWLVTHGGK